jgi:hypothetical protein
MLCWFKPFSQLKYLAHLPGRQMLKQNFLNPGAEANLNFPMYTLNNRITVNKLKP